MALACRPHRFLRALQLTHEARRILVPSICTSVVVAAAGACESSSAVAGRSGVIVADVVEDGKGGS